MDSGISRPSLQYSQTVNAGFYRSIAVVALLYVVLALLTFINAGEALFLVLFAVVLIRILARFWASIPVVVALLVLQSPFPGFAGYEGQLGYNWYTIDVAGVSLSHLMALVVGAMALLDTMRNGFSVKPRAGIALMLLVGLIGLQVIAGLEWKLSWYRFVIDVAISAYFLIFFLIAIVAPVPIRARLRDLLLLVLPAGMAWGIIVLSVLSNWYPHLSMHYDVIAVYVAVALVLNCLGPVASANTVAFRLFSMLSLLVYLVVHPGGVGSIVMLALFFSMLAITLRMAISERSTQAFKMITGGLIMAMLVSAVFYHKAYVAEDPTTRLKLAQITALIESGLDPRHMPYSASVRTVELINIWAILEENTLTLLFGKGAGGYFTEKAYRFPYLTREAFSEDQRETGKFYRPHNNPMYVLLKHGLLGASLWFVSLIMVLLALLFSRSMSSPAFGYGMLLIMNLGFVYGFGVKNSLLIGLVMGLYVMTRTRETENVQTGAKCGA